jgi:hypothetical protein
VRFLVRLPQIDIAHHAAERFLERSKGAAGRRVRAPRDKTAEADGNRTRLSRVAAHTGFED